MTIVLVDDVLYTGRTIRAALGHFLHRGGYERLSPAAHGVGTRVDGRDLVELRQLVQDFRRERCV